MVIDALLLAVGFAGLIIATFSDIKTREVPDWLNFSLIPAGIGLRLMHSLIFNDWMFLVYGIAALAAFVCLAYFLYYARQWGGGDSKLLMGIGVIFATYPEFLLNYFNPILNWHFLLIFLFNLLLVGAVYAMIWSAYLAVKNRRKFKKAYMKFFSSLKFFRRIVMVLVAVMLIASLAPVAVEARIFLLGFSLVMLVSFHLMIFAKVIENCCMFRKIPVSKLTEGDWVVQEVRAQGRYLCGPKDYGLTKEQITQLRKTKIKSVLVKEGIPFVPSFLIAMIVSLVWGNVIYMLF
jgi:Flp pilus assembly protein protease CpaA